MQFLKKAHAGSRRAEKKIHREQQWSIAPQSGSRCHMDQWPGLSKMIDVAPSCGGVMLCCKCLHYACGSPWLFLRPVRGGWGKLPPAYDLLIERSERFHIRQGQIQVCGAPRHGGALRPRNAAAGGAAGPGVLACLHAQLLAPGSSVVHLRGGTRAPGRQLDGPRRSLAGRRLLFRFRHVGLVAGAGLAADLAVFLCALAARRRAARRCATAAPVAPAPALLGRAAAAAGCELRTGVDAPVPLRGAFCPARPAASSVTCWGTTACSGWASWGLGPDRHLRGRDRPCHGIPLFLGSSGRIHGRTPGRLGALSFCAP